MDKNSVLKYFVIIFIVIPITVQAQKGFISVGIDLAFPGGNLKASAGTGIGVTMRYEHPLGQRAAVMGTLGYLSFAEKSINSISPPLAIKSKISMMPIQAGVKFYLFKTNRARTGLFVSSEIGVHTIFTTGSNNGVNIDIPTETDFSYAPGLGYRLKSFEFSYRQQFITGSGNSIDFSNFRIAYVF